MIDLSKYAIPEPNSGCLLWAGSALPRGYGRVSYRGRQIYAHRLAYELHYGPIADGLDVCHRCDTPACINPEHLFAGTPRENMQDAVAKGRIQSGARHWTQRMPERITQCGDRNGSRTRPEARPRGERHGRRTLTAAQVEQIRTLIGSAPQKAIAARFGVAQTTISRIATRRLWV